MAICRTTVLLVTLLVTLWPGPLHGQQPEPAERTDPQVEIVHTVGCVVPRSGDPTEWWLTRAAEPTVTRAGPFNENQVAEAREQAMGSLEFQLIGVAEFLDAEALLDWGDRSQFTTAEQANATAELREGRRVMVKGLLIESDEASRINLLTVVGLSETCDSR